MMSSKKLLCSLILVGGLAKQTAAQLIHQQHSFPETSEKHSKLHFAAGEGLQRHGEDISLILMGEFASDIHLGAIGDHDIGGELGFVLRNGEQALFFAPKVELFRVLGCKVFVKDNIELDGESLHFVPGGSIEVPLRFGGLRGHCFVSGLVDHPIDEHGSVIVLEVGLTTDLK